MDIKHRNRIVQEKINKINVLLARLGSVYRTDDGYRFTATGKSERKFCTMFDAEQEILNGGL